MTRLRNLRWRALAGFLALNLGILFLSITGSWGLQWPWFSSWVHHLNFDIDETRANGYNVIVWCLASLLAIGLAWTPSRGRFWRTGWICCALIAASVAVGEFNDRRLELGSDSIVSAVDANYRFWLVAGPVALPFLLFACWVIWIKIRCDATLRVVAGCACLFGLSAIVRDATQGHFERLYGYEFYHWIVVLEDGYELMMSAVVVVILGSPMHDVTRRSVRSMRALVFSMGIVLGCGVAFLFPAYLVEDAGWRGSRPQAYTGPITVVEQVVRIEHAWLSELEVWAFVEGGDEAQLFARLTPFGDDQPIRESSAEVSHKRWSNQTVRFSFPPIADSNGQSYDVAIGSLSGVAPWVFVGLAGGDPNPYSSVRISGVSTSYDNDVALRTYWKGRGLTTFVDLVRDSPRLVGLVADVVLSFALWLWVSLLLLWRWRPPNVAVRRRHQAGSEQSPGSGRE